MGTLSLPRKVSVLGSTGSIGVSTLDLFEQAGVEVEIVGLTAGRNVARLAEQALRWRPEVAVIDDETLLPELRERLKGSGIATAAGAQAVIDVAAADAQWVMSAIVGFAGLAPTLAAARSGAVIALANKESLVCAGPSLLRIAKLAGGAVVPVDSEHSAIFQVLDPLAAAQVSRLILTSSGGPFRDASREQMAAATLEQALAHPNFSMGAKISIDSATMMNKGLEVIEAAYLFSMPPERIEVLVHPQQIIHSLVEYADGSTLAQLGPPDMRPPIACAFAWPDRLPWPAPKLDLVTAGPLTFQHPDPLKFPALSIAKQALAAGGQAPAAMNAANERAVSAFLDRRIRFLDIPDVVAETLERMDRTESVTALDGDAVERARNTDAAARRVADEVVGGLVAA
ncbi:MAG: 1-deoxy-D-xylulose-5-phosphate reductoisomerase [Phenylobacterium sp.]|uniref:1-deoxy-D-xylulose-5-phosphate reductoisomerase n=1 Tax=Phenylobacterium sp. TaxID=1871053 RepID=UPI0011F833AE|nr:1-deoxy-D-xylulose-5-phosphate reductoisomerase [Phenylobacterium sp.]TAJ73306.1 MAG: 1-deoxy-D-xylulose-5-phosphate reductoisomerase [Phenylobacterium sp.]